MTWLALAAFAAFALAGAPVFALMGRLVANGYHEPSARDARRRIVSFFDQHLSA